MARALGKPFELMRFDGIPVYLTYKTVKRINFTLRTDRIDVSAPKYISVERIQNIFKEEGPRFREKLKQVRSKESKLANSQEDPLNAESVNQVILFGKKLSLCFQRNLSNLKLDGDKLLVPEIYLNTPYSVFDFSLSEFIESELRQYIDKRLEYWGRKTGLFCKSYQIRKMKTRWGSCTYGKGTIRFNFYLAMLPKEVIDSVIIHELCHLKEPNHQKGFYSLLLRYCPNYYELHDYLKTVHPPLNYVF